MPRDKREEADPTLASWCAVPPRQQMDLGIEAINAVRTRPFESIVVYEREHSVRVSVGHDKVVPVYTKRADGLGRTRTGREQRVYKNSGWIYSYRSGELRVFSSHTSGGRRYIHQITAEHSPAPYQHELNEDIMDALWRLYERAVARGLDVPAPFGQSVSEMVHRGAYRMLKITPWTMTKSLGLGPFLRVRTVQEFTSKAFGRSRYRKDLVKAVAGCKNSWQIAVARELVKTVPIDWVISFLKTEQHQFGDYELNRLLRQPGKSGGAYEIAQTMRHLTVESRRRLLVETLWDHNMVRDAVGMLRRESLADFAHADVDFPEPGELRKVRSWRELHDNLSAELNARREIRRAELDRAAAERWARQPRQIALHGAPAADPFGEINWNAAAGYSTKTPESGTIKATKVSKALHKLAIPVLETMHVEMDQYELDRQEFPSIPIKYRETIYTVMRAKKTTELSEWGSKMHNCIASYAADGIRGDTNLFGVYVDGKLMANMEISNNGRIHQLFGPMNNRLERRPDATIRSAVEAKLIKAGILAQIVKNFAAPVHHLNGAMGRLGGGYRDLDQQLRHRELFEGRWADGDDALGARAGQQIAGMVIQPQPNGENLVGIDLAYNVVQ